MDRIKLLFITKDFSNHVERSSYYLSQELAKRTDLMLWSKDGGILDILERIPKRPDFILVNDFKPDYSPFIRKLRQSPVPTGIIMHDLKYKIRQRKRFIEQEGIRHIFSIYRDPFYRYYPEYAERMIWLPHHVPLSIFKDYGEEKTIDWLMTGAIYPHIYPLRNKMYHALMRECGFRYIPHPGYRNIGKRETGVYVGQNYARLLNRSKIVLTCASVEQFPVLKYYEAAACGALLLATVNQEISDLGFIDGQTMVAINEHNFVEKAKYYLQHEDERRRIAENGMALIRSRHSTAKRAEELVQAIHNIIEEGKSR
ncbi:glycosyltransferase family protein [Caenibacillus caldisaponilyticus]|uniref:glycosyltransferase family protein n=1 Tax=Caenibacillus caldisaponilyticus TaxID=1674942 RepID=UPI0009885B6B|nr:glycosyltransferase [Caenibacillus caldisaponilyticus]